MANASFQVEGHPAPSDWFDWTHSPGKIADQTNADLSTDFWNRYQEDFDWANKLGANAFRLSLAWERIEPSPGVFDEAVLKHYDQILLSMRQKGMEPFVTLQHFVLPGWLARRGGILAGDFPRIFADYARRMAMHFSHSPAKVKMWITFNEPTILAFESYILGQWPPGEKDHPEKAYLAVRHFAEAHNLASTLMKTVAPHIWIGVAHHYRLVEPVSDRLDDKVAASIADYFYNRIFLDAITRSGATDYIGFNYYGRSIVGIESHFPFFRSFPGSEPRKSDLGWEVYPQGIYESLRLLNRYKLPLIVTENGVADRNDRLRSDFLREHVAYVMKARNEGIPVFGYLHWSLTDNFEWALGLGPRFGFLEMNYETLTRSPRPSFWAYRDLIHSYKH